ncbi:MAG: hypothetical protein FRX49_07604 [Trebouxia sp. A1-2]|nr:MAG: hypothetical protein FRX49_07604 [Trebouxia sp. A1-2]
MSQIAKRPKGKSSNRHPRGLTLERFAAAKSSGYNKRDKKERQFALDAKKVNKYRKLKSKLQQKGMLPSVSQEDQQETARLKRIQDRAGPSLSDTTDEGSEADDVLKLQHQLPYVSGEPEQKRNSGTARQHQTIKSTHGSQVASGPYPQSHHGTQELQSQSGNPNRHKRQKPKSHLQKIANQVQADKEAVLQEQQAAQKQAAERRDRVAKVEKQRKQQTALLRKKTRTGQPIMKHRIDKILDAL